MDTIHTAINRAIQDGTLNNDACVIDFHNRRNRLAADTELLPDIRDRGLRHLDAVIATELPQAMSNAQPAVIILKREIKAIGNLYHENNFRLSTLPEEDTATASEDAASAKHDDEVKQRSNEMEDVEPEHDANDNGAPPASESSAVREHEDRVTKQRDGSEEEADEEEQEREGNAQEVNENDEEETSYLDEANRAMSEESESEAEEPPEEAEEEDSDYGKGNAKSKAAPKTETKVYCHTKSAPDTVRIPAAMAARRRRKFLTHHPRTNEAKVRTPRVYDILEGRRKPAPKSPAASLAPIDEAEDTDMAESPTPVAPAKSIQRKTAKPKPKPKSISKATDEEQEVNEPALPEALTPAAAARAARANRRGAGIMRSEPSKQPAVQPPLSKAAVRDPSPTSPSLIVKLNVGKPFARSPVPKSQPTIPPKRGFAAGVPYKALGPDTPTLPSGPGRAPKLGRPKVLSKFGRPTKSAEYVDTDAEEEADLGTEESNAQRSIAPTKRSGKTKRATSVEADLIFDDSEEENYGTMPRKNAHRDFMSGHRQVAKEKDLRHPMATTKRSGKFKSAEVVDTDTEVPESEEDEGGESDSELLINPKRRAIPTASTRRGAIAIPHTSTTPDSALEDHSISSTPASDLSTTPSPPHKPSSGSYPPFPALSLPIDEEPFHRGAIIALENIQQDYENNENMSLLDVIAGLNDTRPIVNDREHRNVMAGGGWVYALLRPLAEEAEEQGEEVDVESVVGGIRAWADEEFARLRRRHRS